LTKQRSYVYEMWRVILLGEAEGANAYLVGFVAGYTELEKLIEGKVATLGEVEFYNAVKRLILQVVDMMWMEHLDAMQYLQSSVNLRAYGQRDPLVEYKKEGLRLFREMKESVQAEILRLVPAVGAGAFAKEEAEARERVLHAKEVGGGEESATSSQEPIHSDKTGRNDLCPCGSGKKYKKCHGA